MENKKLTRSNNRMLAGVCAGLADYFGWDVTVVRIIYSSGLRNRHDISFRA